MNARISILLLAINVVGVAQASAQDQSQQVDQDQATLNRDNVKMWADWSSFTASDVQANHDLRAMDVAKAKYGVESSEYKAALKKYDDDVAVVNQLTQQLAIDSKDVANDHTKLSQDAVTPAMQDQVALNRDNARMSSDFSSFIASNVQASHDLRAMEMAKAKYGVESSEYKSALRKYNDDVAAVNQLTRQLAIDSKDVAADHAKLSQDSVTPAMQDQATLNRDNIKMWADWSSFTASNVQASQDLRAMEVAKAKYGVESSEYKAALKKYDEDVAVVNQLTQQLAIDSKDVANDHSKLSQDSVTTTMQDQVALNRDNARITSDFSSFIASEVQASQDLRAMEVAKAKYGVESSEYKAALKKYDDDVAVVNKLTQQLSIDSKDVAADHAKLSQDSNGGLVSSKERIIVVKKKSEKVGKGIKHVASRADAIRHEGTRTTNDGVGEPHGGNSRDNSRKELSSRAEKIERDAKPIRVEKNR